MYDGYRVDETWSLVAAPTTRVMLAEWHYAWPWSEYPDDYISLTVDIPDDSVKELPFQFRFENVPCTHMTPELRSDKTPQTARGAFDVLEAVPKGFVVRYDFICDGARFENTAVLKSVGRRRPAVWPYSRYRPGESPQDRFIQTIKDAWNGIKP